MRYLPIILLLFVSVFCFAQEEEGFHIVAYRGDETASGGVIYGDFYTDGSDSGTSYYEGETGSGRQLEEEGSFYIKSKDNENQTIIQEFKWEPSDDVLMYEFVLQQKHDDGDFWPYRTENTEENYIDCELGAGEYRYRLGLYNFLGIKELETDWVYISVKKAIQPEIKSVSPSSVLVESSKPTTLTVKGADLGENTTFTLVNRMKNFSLPAVVIDKDLARNVFKVQVSGGGLEPGEYALSARNEGGLTFDYSPIELVYSDAFDFCISLGLGIPHNLFQYTIIENAFYWDRSYLDLLFDPLPEEEESYRDYFNSTPDLWLKLTFIPYKSGSGFYGFSINANFFPSLRYDDYNFSSLNQATNIYGETVTWYDVNYRINTMMASAHIDFNYQKMLGTHFVFDAHAGLGVSYCNFILNYATSSYDQFHLIGLCVSGGVTMQWLPWRHFYFELGCDYTFNIFNGMVIHYLDPQFSIGVRF